MTFHIKLAATLNAKAKPRGGLCEAKVRCHFKIPAISALPAGAMAKTMAGRLLGWLAFAIFSFQTKQHVAHGF